MNLTSPPVPRHLLPVQTSRLRERPGALMSVVATTTLGACAASDKQPNRLPAHGPTASQPTALLPPGKEVSTRVGYLAVRDTGTTGTSGEVIVLWPSILADHRIYRAPIEAWQGRHRLVVIDGPGHGNSGAAPAPFTMAQCGQALGEVLDALGIAQPVVVVGTSWGGLVAGEFALDKPQRTRAVVMLNAPVFTAPEGPSFGDRFVAWGARWIHGTGLYRDGVARAFFLPATRARGGPLLEDFHQHLREVDGAALARSVRSVLIERDPLAPRMSAIAAPTLFMAGRYDAIYPLESLRAAASALPKGRFEVLDTAHISVVDAPEQTTALINGFLASLPAAPR
ncbi:MAG: alpha/beta fold hydrolase [Burkholderiales bacterium]|nr:alpha/beta fold hydrolase [Burkholderiales bacterium]